jgi:hypothetical protein
MISRFVVAAALIPAAAWAQLPSDLNPPPPVAPAGGLSPAQQLYGPAVGGSIEGGAPSGLQGAQGGRTGATPDPAGR